MWNSLFGSSEAPQPYAHEVTFYLNGKPITVGSDVSDTMSLNAYIRDVAGLKGTKFMCYEGGCGSCIVAASAVHPVTKKRETFSINSCLVPVLSLQDWDITTVEGLGSKRDGYHQIQAQLAQFNGTQCGFCSPGMVMNMYSLSADKTPTMAEVENAFGGNICRCTGYRPILDAFKALASDATPKMKKACTDIEDLYKICSKTGKACAGSCKKEEEETKKAPICMQLASENWYKVYSLTELFAVFDEIGTSGYKLVAGNTAEAIYRSQGVEKRIDIKDVPELRTNVASPFTVGGNITLTEAITLFNSTTTTGFTYLKQLAEHIDAVANRSVRNIGTIAGNLMLKKQHTEFPSDIYVMLEAVGATLNILSAPNTSVKVNLSDFLSYDMTKKVIHNIEFPKLTDNHKLRTFKIMPRSQNAHAYVNAGFLVRIDNTTNWTVMEKPKLVFGGINPDFNHATNTEDFLLNKKLLDAATISGAMTSLAAELQPDWVLPDAQPEYRKQLAQAVFYKFLLGLDKSKVSPEHASGAENIIRDLSSGTQDFQSDESLWPLNQGIPKLEAAAQTAGEAEYINDFPLAPNELHAIFVLTNVATGNITKVDPGPALSRPGVVAFFEAKDIKGVNNFMPPEVGNSEVEEVFCSGEVQYAGQVVGMIVAETRTIAMSAAGAVIVEYANVTKPVLTIEDVIKTTGSRLKKLNVKDRKIVEKGNQKSKAVVSTIKGKFDIGQQYHMHMESQTSLVIPKEDGVEVYAATQWMDHVQIAVAQTLAIPANHVNVTVRRLGGGYGGKISRATHVAAACAIAADLLAKPVRMAMTMSSNMDVMGKRHDLRNDYEVGVDATGKIEYLNTDIYQNSGFSLNDNALPTTALFFKNCYDSSTFAVNVHEVRTDIASNTWCRAPGTNEGIAFIEEIMEHIARVTKQDPLSVRLANMTTEDNPLPGLIDDLKQKSDYVARRQNATSFNQANRWKKIGMAIVPMQYRYEFAGNFNALVSIFHLDGSVAITHGGIEMGQGMNTKVAQVAAHILKIPLDKISVKPSNNVTAPNCAVTGGSVGSESTSYATMMACQELMTKLEPIREGMTDPTWEELITEAYNQNVDLCSHYMFSPANDAVQEYNIWGVAISEVKVDILTGEKQVLRVDILEDVGQSLSPLVDVGQIEGAFIMGMGYWLSEQIVYDPDNGRITNNSTWNYKVPGPKDIPVEFNIHFRRDAPNPNGVLKSKATGEPAFCMSISTLFAVRDALDSARKDAGDTADYYEMKTPASAETIYMTSMTDPSQFQL